jgi:hypothetical protein
MDVKRNRRDAAEMGKTWDTSLPMVEGMYPADGKKGHGIQSSDNGIGWDVRAQSWQRGADTNFEAIEAEKRENDVKFGTPHADNFPAPSDPAGPPNCGARYQTASYDGDAAIKNPHNFSSNPGFMSIGPPTGSRPTSWRGLQTRSRGNNRVTDRVDREDP